MFAGVDGCSRGWVAFVLPQQRLVEGFTDFADLLVHLEDLGVTTIGVDMPIGPPDTGERDCDLAVRAALGAKAASLFMTPTAAALRCATQAEASAVNRAHGGKGVSAQAFALRAKIAEVASARPRAHMVEVHPELAFHLLAAPRHRKRSWAGVRERVRILQGAGLDPFAWDSQGWGEVDDTLDAAVAALSARRVAAGDAVRFPAHGTGAAIWA